MANKNGGETNSSSSNSNTTNTSTGQNVSHLNMGRLEAMNALYDHDQSKMNSGNKPVNVTGDKFDETRIRLAVIDNYLIERNDSDINPINPDNVINMSTGKVVIKWIDYNGGIIRPEEFGYPSKGYTEQWKYTPSKDSKYPEERSTSCYNHDKASEKEMLELSHAFIWSNGSNWCGMNYIPPVGSIVTVGFKKNNMPVILGYVPTDFANCKPNLKPGETLIKGYGDNYIHWRWSNKLDIGVKSKQGELDLDDPYKRQTYPSTMQMWMRFDCYTRNFLIDVQQSGGGRTTVEVKPEICKITSGSSTLSVSSSDIFGSVGSDKIYIGGGTSSIQSGSSKVSVNSGSISINTGGALNINASSVNVNSSGSTSINSGSGVSISSGGALSVNSSSINLTSSGSASINGSSVQLASGGTIQLSASAVNGNASQYNFN